MLLNENTYEEIFILYIDNELTANERAAVEAFAQSNPQYNEALKTLQDTKLIPTLHTYDDKALLYRFDTMNAQLDNTFKQSLYKKEGHTIRPMFNKKMWASLSAIAALFILVIGYAIFENKPSTHTLETIAKTNTIHTDTQSLQKESQLAHLKEETIIAKGIVDKKTMPSLPTKIILTRTPTSSMNTIVSPQVAKNISIEIASNTIEVSTANSMKISDNNIENSAIASTASNHNLTNNHANSADADQPTEDYTVLNTDHSDKIIYIANLEIDSEKLRGISRKVSALFKRNKTEKEK